MIRVDRYVSLKIVGLLVAVTLLLFPAFAEDMGHIQVKCEPGVQILLDGILKGVTNADVGGLIVTNVTAGRHQIKAIKAGFMPQETEVTLTRDQILLHTLKPFIPQIELRERGEETGGTMVLKVGSVLIKSLPVECSIDIPDMGLRNQRKTKPEMEMTKVPEGVYQASFTGMGKTLQHRVEVVGGQTTELMVNFLDGKVVDLSIEARQKAEETRRKSEEEKRKLVEGGLYYTDWPFNDVEAKRRQKLTAEKLRMPLEYEADLGNGVKMAFVLIPAGEFLMGSPDNEPGRDSDEGPVHRVSISKPFYMGKHEVTQAQWEAAMGGNPSKFRGERNPVEQVSWEDCQEFGRKLNERIRNAPIQGGRFALPTEAQWEYACRAGSGHRYSFGADDTDLGGHAWYSGNSGSKTHPVGERTPNAWGLCDMHGNVWEWCQDWHGAYGGGDAKDPGGPANGSVRVLRGGSWFNVAAYARSAVRLGSAPGYRRGGVGCRFVLRSYP